MASDTSHVARQHPGRPESPDQLRPPPAPAAMRLQKIVAFSHVQLGCATSCPTLTQIVADTRKWEDTAYVADVV